MKINDRKPVTIDINEGEGEGLMRLHFLALTAGVPTGNGHRYSTAILKKAADEFNARAEKYGPAMGGTKHPKDEMNLDDVAMMIHKVKFDENDQGLYVDSTVLPTSKGRSVAAILKAKGRIGCSVRGVGDVGEGGDVKSFSLKAVDLVLNPSTENYVGPENVYESMEIPDEDHDLLEEKYRQAIQFAGFRGDLNDFKKVFVELNEAKKKKEPEPAPKAKQGEPEDEADLAFAEELLAKIESGLAKLGHTLEEVDEDETTVFTFCERESQYYRVPYTLLPDNSVQLGKPEAVEV